MRCGYTLAAGCKALDPERAVYLISVKSSVWDLVLNQTHEPNAAVLIRDSGLLRREGIVKSLPGRPSRNHRLHSSPPQRLRNANRGRLRLLYVKVPPLRSAPPEVLTETAAQPTGSPRESFHPDVFFKREDRKSKKR